MKYRLTFKDGAPEIDFEGDDQAIDGDWLLLKRYVTGRGLVVCFRVRHSEVDRLEVVDESDEREPEEEGQKVESSIGRVWSLLHLASGATLEEALTGLDDADEEVTAEVERRYRAAEVPIDSPPPGRTMEQARRVWAGSLGKDWQDFARGFQRVFGDLPTLAGDEGDTTFQDETDV
jgi:hypothetical protein